MSYDFIFKFIIIGDSNVGKSSLMTKFIYDSMINDYESTVGVDFGSKIIDVNNKKIKLQIWDTAGQESYRSITRSYYKNTACCLIVFDITNKKSFENISRWIDELYIIKPNPIITTLIGNKYDMKTDRKVTYTDAITLAIKNNMEYYETSAINNKNIEKIFFNNCEKLIEKIIRGNLKEENGFKFRGNQTSVKLDIYEKNNKYNKYNSCCQ